MAGVPKNEGSPPTRSRMSAAERREQLITISRGVFAERGYDGASIEEVAARAGVSKPVVYEHFGGKEGLYAVVVDRDVTVLLTMMREALSEGSSRKLLEQAATAFLDFIDLNPDGFRILVRDSPLGSQGASFQSILGDVATRVEDILVTEFKKRGFDPKQAPMYSQMLVGMIGTTGQWWLDNRKPSKQVVAANVVNLAWHGLAGLEKKPGMITG